MSILGTTDLGNGKLLVTVDHDPTATATDCPTGSMIVNVTSGQWYRKRDDGSTTNVRDIYALETKVDGVATGATNTPLTGAPPANVTRAIAVAGVGTSAARDDHKHDITTAAPGATGVATASGDGAASSLARSDHIHQSNTAPVNVTKAAAAIGTSGEPARADHKHDAATAAPAANGVATSSADGSATTLARSDHTHQSNTAPSSVTKAAAAVGTSGEPARADHKHDITTATVSEITDSTNSEGAATSVARSDHGHSHGIRGGGNLHSAVVAGVTNGFMLAADKTKLDSVPLLTSTAPVNVTKAAAAVGIGTEAARNDHKHDVTTAAPSIGIGGSNAEGAATSVARSDHNHALRETAGPTDLTIGAIANGEYLRRSGATIIGGSPGGSVFGADYQIVTGASRTTTTANAYGGVGTTKLTLTTPALTGTYRVAAFATLDQGAANQLGWARLYNNTDAVVMAEQNHRPSNVAVQAAMALCCADVVFAGAAKSFVLQFRSGVAGDTTGCRYARIELWRVS